MLHPDDVELRDGRYWVADVRFDPGEIIHLRGQHPIVDGRGTGVLTRFAQRARHHHRRCGRTSRGRSPSGVPAGYLKTSQPNVTQEQADTLKSRWMTQHGGRRTIAVLNSTTEFHPLTWSPVDTEAAEFSQLTLSQIALMFGLPVSHVGWPVRRHSLDYSTTELRMIELYQLTLLPWIGRIEAVLNAQFPAGTVDPHRGRRPAAGRHQDPVRGVRHRHRQRDPHRRRGPRLREPSTPPRSRSRCYDATSSTPRSPRSNCGSRTRRERIVEGIVVPWGETSFLTPDPKGERFRRRFAHPHRSGNAGDRLKLFRAHDHDQAVGRAVEWKTGRRRRLLGTVPHRRHRPPATRCSPKSAKGCSTRSRSGSSRSGCGAAPTVPARSSKPALHEVSICPIGAYDGARVLAMRTPVSALVTPLPPMPEVNLAPVPMLTRW